MGVPLSATLSVLLAARAALPGPALIERGRPVSYAALWDESRRVAQGFARLGVRPGDRVALWLPNVSAWLVSFFACAQLGAIAVAVNTRFRSHEIADIVARSGCRLLVFWPGFGRADFSAVLAGCAPDALSRVETIIVYGENGEPTPPSLAGRPALAYASLAASPPLAERRVTGNAGCAIFTTSGTTKAPKFVLHDQQTLIRHAFDVARAFGIDATSTVLLAPPLCGVFGFCSALAAFAAGRPLVMAPAWDAAEAARQIDACAVTHVNATDDAIAQLLAQNERAPAFPSVRFMGYAAFNPGQADIVARAAARGLAVVGLYGTSEIQALFARQDENAPLAERAAAGGLPVDRAARVRARDPETGRIMPHGESGELEFFAPNSRMTGYFGDPEASAAALSAEGWYRSGDLGVTLADGRFVFLARMGDALRLGGFLVSPLEIEGVVQSAPGISACQVVGVPTAAGPKAVAFVILAPGAALDEEALLGHVAARLARYKVPVRAFAIDAFPVTEGTNATKIQKHRLRELAQQAMSPLQSEEEEP